MSPPQPGHATLLHPVISHESWNAYEEGDPASMLAISCKAIQKQLVYGEALNTNWDAVSGRGLTGGSVQ